MLYDDSDDDFEGSHTDEEEYKDVGMKRPHFWTKCA